LFLRGILHDWHKLLPSEWFPYSNYFYGSQGDKHQKENKGKSYQAGNDLEFDTAWLFHIHRAKHHWQHWILKEDCGDVKVLPMPEKYLIEMLCDWIGAGKVQGRPDTLAWYEEYKSKIILDEETRARLEGLLYGR
jgi:hypothetical protein